MFASLPLGQSCDYHSASDVSVKDMGKIDWYLAKTKQPNVNNYWNVMYISVLWLPSLGSLEPEAALAGCSTPINNSLAAPFWPQEHRSTI